MPRPAEYHSSYPRSGQVALLCEGDVAGYEVSLLRSWLDAQLGAHPLVDLWPCGTASALYGFSDAIGRSRPIVVVEDRDFRTPNEAEVDCRRYRKDREGRAVRVAAWLSWNRNEIENYLLDREILLPVFTEAFDCSSAEVESTLAEVVASLPVFQAIQSGLYHARRVWALTAPDPYLRTALRELTLPRWAGHGQTLVAPAFEAASERMAVNVSRWAESASGSSRAFAPGQKEHLLREVEQRYLHWSQTPTPWPVVLEDWSGKEVLLWLRRALAARRGLGLSRAAGRERIDWTKLSRPDQDRRDRGIEDALRRPLALAFRSHLSHSAAAATHADWYRLVAACREAGSLPVVSSTS